MSILFIYGLICCIFYVRIKFVVLYINTFNVKVLTALSLCVSIMHLFGMLVFPS